MNRPCGRRYDFPKTPSLRRPKISSTRTCDRDHEAQGMSLGFKIEV
jgi:hypothetical protein